MVNADRYAALNATSQSTARRTMRASAGLRQGWGSSRRPAAYATASEMVVTVIV
jgi:hypothetical protein